MTALEVQKAIRAKGKHDQKVAEKFLSCHKHDLPRTTLRYAIERMSGGKRKLYLARR